MIHLANTTGRSIGFSEKGGTDKADAAKDPPTGRW